MKIPDRLERLSPGWQTLTAVLLITAALLLFYSNSFTADWHYDDFHHIKENINIRKISNLPMFFTDASTFSRNPVTRMYRPLLMSTHAINYQFGLMTARNGYDIRGYHVVNFLFHLAATLAVFFIVLFLFRRRIQIEGVSPILIATFAGLLFGLHTINTETIVYISSRSSAMATAFVLMAFYGYLRATREPSIRYIPLLLSAVSYGFGLLSKEIAITLPAMLIYYEWTLNRDWMSDRSMGAKLKGLSLRMAPYGFVALGFLYVRNLVLHDNLVSQITSKGGTAAAPDLKAQVATQSRVWIYYLREVLWSTGLSIDKPFRVSRDLTEPMVVLSILLIVALIAGAILVRRRHPVITFGVLWYFTALLPTSVFRLNVVINDHRLYLPVFGLVLVFTYVVSKLYLRFRSDGGWYYRGFVAICVAILLLMGLGTFKRNMAFATEESMWKDVILKDRKSVRGYNNLGIYYEQQKDFEKALKHYSRTIKLAPMFPNPYINIGNVYHKQKKYQEAEKFMKKAISLDPKSALANYNLGNILREAGKTEEAIAVYKRALELNPRYIEAANNLANIYFKARKFDEAIGYYRKALFIDPTFAMSYYNIGLAHENKGRKKEAMEAFNEFIRYWRGDRKYLAIAQSKIKRLTQEKTK